MRESPQSKSNCPSMSQVIGLVCQGDPGGFDLIYRSYRELVQRICLRTLRDPTEAEDASQDVFVRVLSKIHTFRGESAFSSWLYRLTTNIVLMRLRKNKHTCLSLCEPLNDANVPCGEIGGFDAHLRGLSSKIDLEAAIDLLPKGYKSVFILHDVQGYEHKEIAEIFKYSIGNSKSQLHKARKRLRKLLCDNKEMHQHAELLSNPLTVHGLPRFLFQLHAMSKAMFASSAATSTSTQSCYPIH